MELVPRLVSVASSVNNGDAVGYARAGKRVFEWRQAHDDRGAVRAGNKTKAMSQIVLAKRADVSVGCLQGLEQGSRATRDENLEKIARAIGLTAAELVSDDPTEIAAAVPDTRALGLRDEDFEIAHLFHNANTDVRVAVRSQLRTDAYRASQPRADLAQVIDRRSGMERRAVAHNARTAESPPMIDPATDPDGRIAHLVEQVQHRCVSDPDFVALLEGSLNLDQPTPKAKPDTKPKLKKRSSAPKRRA
jgi:transcriptional regulator with XRE-family HTH domain